MGIFDFLDFGKYVIDFDNGKNVEHNVMPDTVEFNNSIYILPDEVPIDEFTNVGLFVYTNLPGLFANELNPNDEGLGIECNALDINGYEFEFTI